MQGHRRQGQTALSIAVYKNNKDLVRLLVSSHASLEVPDNNGETPIFQAVRKGKLPMIKELVNLKCDFNRLNRDGENVLFAAVRLGRRDLVEYLIKLGVNVDVVNKGNSTAILLALELYENCFYSGYATRRAAPSNMSEIVTDLVPRSSLLNHTHVNRGTALRNAFNIEAAYSSHDLKLTKLLLQHGALPDRFFFLRCGGIATKNNMDESECFSEKFFELAILAGASLQKERLWLHIILREMPEVLSPYLDLFNGLLRKCSNPLALQSLCVMSVRDALCGPLYKAIDSLPLPCSIQNQLKLIQ